MNKLFSKVAALSVGLAMAIGVGVAVGSKEARVAKADSDTFSFSDNYVSSVQEGNVYVSHTWSDSIVTFVQTKGSGTNAVANYTTAPRWYTNHDITVTPASGVTITAISFTTTKGSLSWSGEESQAFVINPTEQVRPTSATITYSSGSADVLESITVTGSMSKTAYYVGESWSPAGLVATGHYQTAGNKDISDKVTWTYSPASPALNVTSVVATASIGEVSGSSSAQTVSVSRANPIQVLYTKSASESVDVYGYYVGFLDGTGPVIMDGAYGIVIYNSSADVSGYTEKETILHVTGSITIFKGLYEIGSASISIASGTFDAPDTPVVYATNGSETAEYASRLTTVTGTPTLTSGSFESDAGTADIKMNFAVGTKTVQVFYKKAAQTADADAFAAIKAAVADSTEITIKGFTGWYNGFQVQMNGYIAPAESYTAEDFAQDLLDQTDAVCAGWEEGDNNHDALEAIWSDLASNDKYPSLPAAQKTILADANRDESGTVVEQAMARYDFLTGKYDLSNFINGRTPIVPAGRIDFSNDISQNSSMIIIVSIAATSALAFTLLLVFKKKKQK
ncbi:MAG: hypothetical protein IJQ72_04205 [Bacilli bacterium]|nr:hypothetical protein [Bacilli bacterium]